MESWAKRDLPAYHVAVSAARKAQAIVFRYHCSSLSKLQTGSNNRLWWNLTKRISVFCRPHTRFAPDVDSLAPTLYFASKLSFPTDFDSASLTLPPEVSTATCKKSWWINLSKVHHVLSSLDVKKAVGPEGVSPYTLKCLLL